MYTHVLPRLVAVWAALILAQDLSAQDLPAPDSAAAAIVPHWIAAREVVAGERTYFRQVVEFTQPVTSARLVAAGYAAGIDCYLNGKLVFELDPYDPLLKLDLTQEFAGEKHVIAVRCRQESTTAMFFLRLQFKLADGTQRILVTDDSWQCGAKPAAGWMDLIFKADGWSESFARAAVDERLQIPDGRRIDLAASDNYEQWRLASGEKGGAQPAKFSITPGFRIELVRAAAASDGSWISLVFDPQGRAIISQEQEGLLRMTLAKDGSSVQSVERINDDLKEVRGMAFFGRDLYVNANNSKAMYRLRGDTDGDFGKPELLFATQGGVGHGRNDLAVGPDGKVYSIHGDDVDVHSTAKDYTLRAGEVRPDNSPGEGHLVRFDPATGKVEMLVRGLRNPYGIAFNADGEMFTYDADAEFDMGAPWYRPTRAIHLTLGSDFGWRSVTGQWPPYYPDHPENAPFSLNIGKGSPTAVMFGSRSNFPRRYREALFILDWAYGRILAVHCLPQGASYLCEAETFLKGRPLNVTDLDFAPDGSMYLITGGRKTQSALYRVRFVGERHAADLDESDGTQVDRSAAEARRRRRELEALLEATALEPGRLDQIWSAIGDADPRIRCAARIVLERQPVALWEHRALGEQNRLSALTALVGLARSGDAAIHARILKRLNDIELASASRTERHLAAWIYHHCVVANGALEPSIAESVRNRLGELYPDRNYLVNQQLSLALAHLGAKDFVDKTMPLLSAATEQSQQMHNLFILRNVATGWRPSARQNYFDFLAQAGQFVGGEGMPGFLDRIRNEALAAVSDDGHRGKFADQLARDHAAVEAPLAPRPFVKKWNVSDALAATQALSDKPDLKRGFAVFSAASCSKCHRLGSVGTPFGPDLTAVSSRFSRRDILESIVEPSKSIADNYRSLEIVTEDGKVYLGRPVLGGDFRSQKLRLATNPQHPLEITEIDKRTIDRENFSAVSWMPEGLLDSLAAEEVRDLLALLEAGGRSE
jgi:putative heme-binding domain-containing protein